MEQPGFDSPVCDALNAAIEYRELAPRVGGVSQIRSRQVSADPIQFEILVPHDQIGQIGRLFGITTAIGCAVVGAALSWYDHASAAKVVWAVGALIGVLGVVIPLAVKPVYLLLALISWPIGVAVSFLMLAFLYYVVITGTGLVWRLLGRDLLQRNRDPDATTYWQPKTPLGPESKERYLRQF